MSMSPDPFCACMERLTTSTRQRLPGFNEWIWGQAISGRTTYTVPCCEEFDQATSGLGDPKSLSASFTCRGTRGPKPQAPSAKPQAASLKQLDN